MSISKQVTHACFDLKASGFEVKLRQSKYFNGVRSKQVIHWRSQRQNVYHVIVSLQSSLPFVVDALLLAFCFAVETFFSGFAIWS